MERNDADLLAEVRTRVAALGFELVDLRQRGAGQRQSLQIRIDRPDSGPGHGVTADDCAVVSRALERWLDDSGVLGGRYVLEVSSPGIERPLRWIEHWRRFTGRDVRVRLPGSGRIEATIVRVEQEDRIVLRLRGAAEEITVPVDEARDATLLVDWSKVDRSFTGTTSEESA
jgi:ribosome maturation factor RimP